MILAIEEVHFIFGSCIFFLFGEKRGTIHKVGQYIMNCIYELSFPLNHRSIVGTAFHFTSQVHVFT